MRTPVPPGEGRCSRGIFDFALHSALMKENLFGAYALFDSSGDSAQDEKINDATAYYAKKYFLKNA